MVTRRLWGYTVQYAPNLSSALNCNAATSNFASGFMFAVDCFDAFYMSFVLLRVEILRKQVTKIDNSNLNPCQQCLHKHGDVDL